MTDLTLWSNTSSLSKHQKRKLEKQLKRMDDVVEVVIAGLDEESQTYGYANDKVSETLSEADRKKSSSGVLSEETKADYGHLTQHYLDTVIRTLASNDSKMLREIERAAGGKIDLKLLDRSRQLLLSDRS